ncbi:liver stage antigen-3 [Aphelenchoides avenae]|nr:liver stage antigen-3 [Aphelenchus avenae]
MKTLLFVALAACTLSLNAGYTTRPIPTTTERFGPVGVTGGPTYPGDLTTGSGDRSTYLYPVDRSTYRYPVDHTTGPVDRSTYRYPVDRSTYRYPVDRSTYRYPVDFTTGPVHRPTYPVDVSGRPTYPVDVTTERISPFHTATAPIDVTTVDPIDFTTAPVDTFPLLSDLKEHEAFLYYTAVLALRDYGAVDLRLRFIELSFKGLSDLIKIAFANDDKKLSEECSTLNDVLKTLEDFVPEKKTQLEKVKLDCSKYADLLFGYIFLGHKPRPLHLAL